MKKNLWILLFFCCLTNFSLFSQSPYISKVYDYMPAPGQFVNKLPEYESGDTHEDMILKVEESIVGDEQIAVTLGAYGGYVVFGFDHPVVNVVGEKDFRIFGNAFWANSNPNQEASRRGGSSEPGIVMVSYDANGNGIPDDAWYELAGSEYHKPETVKNYEITYFRPDENKEKVPMPGQPMINDMTYVKWENNRSEEGYVYRNTFHKQPYYPQWVDADNLTFMGTKLADNYIDESGTGSYYVQYAYDWGYADNAPNNEEASALNIEWAVDAEGNSVQLPAIHFVKVYTGVNQYCGWLGETSTEILGAEDLHPDAEISNTGVHKLQTSGSLLLLNTYASDYLTILSEKEQPIVVYSTTGTKTTSINLHSGTNYVTVDQWTPGLYLLTNGNETIRFIKQ